MRTTHLTAFLAAALAVALGSAAPAQTTAATPPKKATPAGLLTKTDLETTGTQLRQKVDAQAVDIAALREQISAMQAQLRTLDLALNGPRSPQPPIKH
ncbi:MAG: hypothetical protein M3Y13_14495 [Armatimonadota bacterium]|nr:hypothetical protein [Armatimonadota bacterium]